MELVQAQDVLEFRILTLEIVESGGRWNDVEDNCVVRLVGKDAQDVDVCVCANGFFPYFYLKTHADWKDWQLSDLRSYIIARDESMGHNLVGVALQRSISTFCFSDGQLCTFVKLSFRGVRSMNKCKRIFAGQLVKLEDDDQAHVYEVCEADKVPPILKFLHDTGLQPSGWVRIARDKCTPGKKSKLARNYVCNIKDLSSFNCDNIPGFIEASIDGEMVAPSWTFPRAERKYDMVVQIAVYLTRRGQEAPLAKVLFCVGPMGDLSEHGIEVRSSKTEPEMLLDFSRQMDVYNPDIITGHNIVDFDFPYLLKRGNTLRLPHSFFLMGRFHGEPTQLKVSYRSQAPDAKDKEKIKYDVPVLPGRRVEDVYLVDKKFLRSKRHSYNLETIAMETVGEGKHDVTFEDVFRSYTDWTDRMMATDAVTEVRDFLSELRLMRVLERLPDPVPATVGQLKQVVADKWDRVHRPSVLKALDGLLQGSSSEIEAWSNVKWDDTLPVPTGALASVVQTYICTRRVGDILIFASLKLDLRARCQGVSLAEFMSMGADERVTEAQLNYDPRDVKFHAKQSTTTGAVETKRSQNDDDEDDSEVESTLANFEVRVARELDLVQDVLEHNVTRKFAEKWWRLRQDIRACNGGDTSEAVEFLRQQAKQEQAYLFAEKTRVGLYCVKDAELPCRIRRTKQHLIALMEMSKISCVPVNMLMEKGETIKVINLFLLWCRAHNYIATVRKLASVVFVGGQVLTPETGFWETLVSTLDYSSLYPSVMQAHGLCFLALIHPDDEKLYLGRPDLVIEPINIGPPSNVVYHWVRNRQTALPEILRALVAERSAVKADYGKETDPTRKIILDQRQNAIKLVANATYGFTGYERSPWPCLPIAVCTTVMGRLAIATAKSSAEEMFGCRVIYGDSVTAPTPVLVRHDHGNVEYVAIAELPRQTEWQQEGDKEVAQPLQGLCIWSDQGFTPVHKVIRHRTDKEIFRVQSGSGSVCVTSDHSMLRANGDEVRPVDLRLGDDLMHADLPVLQDERCVLHMPYTLGLYFGKPPSPDARWSVVHENRAHLERALEEWTNSVSLSFRIRSTGDAYELVCGGADEDRVTATWAASIASATGGKRVPVAVLNAPLNQVRTFLAGYCDAVGCDWGAVRHENDLAAAGLLFLYHRLGVPVGPVDGDWVRASSTLVRDITPLAPTKDYVYDLQTDNHHFAAGVGRLVVHNTDSIMIIFPGLDDMPKDKRLEYVFEMSKRAAAEISKKFVAPMKLLFEKVYWPYLLGGKKRYCGWKYMSVDEPGKLDTKGFENVRRDNCLLLRNGLENVFQVLMRDMDPGKATRVGRKLFERIANQDVPMEELVISQTLGENYKLDTLVHVKVAQYLQQHNPLLAPQIGDRVPYVIVKLPGESRSTKKWEKGYNAEMTVREKKEIDWAFYCFKQIKKPLDRIFCIIHGFTYKKGANARQETDYLWEPFVDMIRANDKVQQARVNGNASLDSFTRTRKQARTINADDVPERPVVVKRKPQRDGDISTMFKKKQ